MRQRATKFGVLWKAGNSGRDTMLFRTRIPTVWVLWAWLREKVARLILKVNGVKVLPRCRAKTKWHYHSGAPNFPWITWAFAIVWQARWSRALASDNGRIEAVEAVKGKEVA